MNLRYGETFSSTCAKRQSMILSYPYFAITMIDHNHVLLWVSFGMPRVTKIKQVVS
jgi:hypothetical protein